MQMQSGSDMHGASPSFHLSEPLLQPKSVTGGVCLGRLAGQDDNIHQLLPHFMINPTSIDFASSYAECTQFSIGSTELDYNCDPSSDDGLSTTSTCANSWWKNANYACWNCCRDIPKMLHRQTGVKYHCHVMCWWANAYVTMYLFVTELVTYTEELLVIIYAKHIIVLLHSSLCKKYL